MRDKNALPVWGCRTMVTLGSRFTQRWTSSPLKRLGYLYRPVEARASGAAAERPPVQVLLLGGRSGVGKTSIGFEVSGRLQAVGVEHCLVDGDNLSATYPRPRDDPDGSRLGETNLRALWATYSRVGQRRMLYVNTVSVVNGEMVRRVVGARATIRGVLLTARDDTVRRRLGSREIGSFLEEHLEASRARDAALRSAAEDWVLRVATDGRTVTDIASDVIDAVGWSTDR